MISAALAQLGNLDVSRETLDALQAFADLVTRWNPSVNLVSRSTLPDIWTRHILDSAQLFALCPPNATCWLDLGAGGGFPGIVIAILAREKAPQLRLSLVDSDHRKAAFLREAARLLHLDISVHSARIETLPPQNATVLSARALAPLDVLLGFAVKHLSNDGVALFPKGARHTEEVEKAQKTWRFDLNLVPSLSDPSAAILEIRNIHSANDD